MIAVPCSPTVPDSRIRSPGSIASVAIRARGSRRPTPVVQTYILSAAPRSTTFVSPATICTSAASAARAIASTSAFSSSAVRPSSRMSERLSASGRAPETARSLTVPLTARSPIEPPGKVIGLTTKESVVIASSTPSTSTAPASPIASSVCEPNAGTNRPSIMLWVALPPAPWAMLMRSSRNFPRLPRAVSMIPRMRASRSLTGVAVGCSATQTTSRSRAKRP